MKETYYFLQRFMYSKTNVQTKKEKFELKPVMVITDTFHLFIGRLITKSLDIIRHLK